MSRFERRLKPEKYNSRSSNNISNRSASPRPGTATCKIRAKSQKILSGFISVQEKTQNSKVYNSKADNSKQSKIIIEELESKKLVETDDDIINRVMMVNEQLKLSITRTNNPTLKRLLSHELRLNTIELNLDCLTNLKCVEVSKTQENESEVKSIEDTVRKVNTFDETVSKLNLENNKLNNDLKKIKNVQEEMQNISLENKNLINNKLNILEEITREIENLKDNNVDGNNTNDSENELEMLKQEISYLKENNNELTEKLENMTNFINLMIEKFNNKDTEHFDELIL